jgi:chemotaxis protein methyltransferase CheR
MDIILCRNLLIYFEKDLQEKVFEKFYYSLKPGGFIVLGKSEVPPLSYRENLLDICKKEKIYQKVAQ